MTDTQHIKAFRLFDFALTEAKTQHLQLTDWESEHLRKCSECTALLGVFGRQVRERPPFFTAANGEQSPKDARYRSLCCGFEKFVGKGDVFPDCPRHQNLPTVWK